MRTVPRSMLYGRDRRLRDLLHAAVVALSAMPVFHTAHGTRRARAAADRALPGRARLPERPGARRSSTTSASAAGSLTSLSRSTWASSPRRSSSSATNAGVIGASRITYAMSGYRQLPLVFRRIHPKLQDAVARARLLRRLRSRSSSPPRQDELPRHDVLVRRDALVHDRPRLDDPAPDGSSATRTSRVEGRAATSGGAGSTGRSSRSSAASGRVCRGSSS